MRLLQAEGQEGGEVDTAPSRRIIIIKKGAVRMQVRDTGGQRYEPPEY